MSKESKIAILAIISLAILVLGYKFIIGKSVLTKVQFFNIRYKNIDGLKVSNPVSINGYQIGAVNKIILDPADNITPIVTIELHNDIHVPKDAIAYLSSTGIMGGKAIELKFNGVCNDGTCARSGDFLRGESKSLLSNFVNEGEIKQYTDQLKNAASDLFDTLAGPSGKSDLKQTVKNLQITLQNLANTTASLSGVMSRNSSKLDRLITNLESVTSNIQKSNGHISRMLKNIDTIAYSVAKANPGETVNELNSTLKTSRKAIENLQNTIKTADASLTSVSQLIAKAQSGNGTAAKLLNDPNLYNNLSNTSRQLELLLQDLRLNPKRYVNVSVFGKKQKEFVPNDHDPAMKNDTTYRK